MSARFPVAMLRFLSWSQVHALHGQEDEAWQSSCSRPALLDMGVDEPGQHTAFTGPPAWRSKSGLRGRGKSSSLQAGEYLSY